MDINQLSKEVFSDTIKNYVGALKNDYSPSIGPTLRKTLNCAAEMFDIIMKSILSYIDSYDAFMNIDFYDNEIKIKKRIACLSSIMYGDIFRGPFSQIGIFVNHPKMPPLTLIKNHFNVKGSLKMSTVSLEELDELIYNSVIMDENFVWLMLTNLRDHLINGTKKLIETIAAHRRGTGSWDYSEFHIHQLHTWGFTENAIIHMTEKINVANGDVNGENDDVVEEEEDDIVDEDIEEEEEDDVVDEDIEEEDENVNGEEEYARIEFYNIFRESLTVQNLDCAYNINTYDIVFSDIHAISERGVVGILITNPKIYSHPDHSNIRNYIGNMFSNKNPGAVEIPESMMYSMCEDDMVDDIVDDMIDLPKKDTESDNEMSESEIGKITKRIKKVKLDK